MLYFLSQAATSMSLRSCLTALGGCERWWWSTGLGTGGSGAVRGRAASHIRIFIFNATFGGIVHGRANIVRGCSVHTESNPSKYAVRDIVAEQNVLNHRVNLGSFLR